MQRTIDLFVNSISVANGFFDSMQQSTKTKHAIRFSKKGFLNNLIYTKKYLSCIMLIAIIVFSGCAPIKPPYNDFRPKRPDLKKSFLNLPVRLKTKAKILSDINNEDMQYVKYGDINTLIIPTDRYFEFNSSTLNDRCYKGLLDIVNLLRYHPCAKVKVAAFTDDVGSKTHKYMLSQARAEAMLTFLWANDIDAISSKGYADRYAIGDNYIIHGSAYNRRIELQWISKASCCCQNAKEALKFATK